MDLFGFFIIALILLFLVVVLVVVGILVSRNPGKPNKPAPVVEQKPVQVEVKPVEKPMAKPVIEIPPGMKECFQCKSIIRGDVITCPHCGKNPSKLAFQADSLGKIGSSLFIIGLLILIPFICAMCGYLGG